MKNVLSLLIALPVATVVLSACGESKIKVNDSSLTSSTLTQAHDVELYPDDRPSVPDGKIYWAKQDCASCHGATGSGGAGSNGVNLADKVWLRKQKPIDEYMLVSYATKDGKPVQHPAMHEKLTKRQMWDLVWYTRSLAVPELANETIADMDAVFGSNCAVCHGKKGKGDGPLAHNLEPVPANFSLPQRFFDRTDDVLYDHIANGIQWEGMPNFLGKEDKAKNVKFDQEYIWKLVQYVRHFSESNEATIAQAPEPAKDSDQPAK